MGFFNKNKEPKIHKAKTALQQGLSEKEYKKFDKQLFSDNLELSIEERKILCLAGAMLGKDEQKVDKFPEYDVKKNEQISKQFEATYGELSEATIENTVADILEHGFTEQYNSIYNIITSNKEDEWSPLAERICQVPKECADRLKYLKQTFKYLSDYTMPMPNGRLAAYDIVRASNITAVAVGLDIIDREKAFVLLNKCYDKAKQNYKTFDEFFSSYVFGRAIWLVLSGNALAIGNTRDINICYMLINSEKSCLKDNIEL